MLISPRIITVDPQEPAESALDAAARVLARGGLVAFATETVYGLGADATNPAAVARIYEAKGRPAFNPLIVHAGDTAMARACVRDWPEPAAALAEAFWPGPLTLVLPRSALIPDVVTAGRDTVGVRIPAPAVARRLIDRFGRPVAAPSANRSTGISPTLAQHVAESLGGRIDLILDSGPTTVGLESTVLDLSTPHPRVLRPGPILAAEIERVLHGAPVAGPPARPDEGPHTSPGQMAVHYAPRTLTLRTEEAVDLARISWPRRAALLVVGQHPLPPLPPGLRQFHLETPDIAARDLYAVLHRCDASDLDLIVALLPADRPEWTAIRDRLRRAASPIGMDAPSKP